MFKVTRIFADPTGESHFDDIEVPLHPAGKIGNLSDPVAVKSLLFREVIPSYDWDFHTAPQRQYIILLDGAIEIETSSNERREFGPGDILLVEDTWGKGHRTRNTKNIVRKSLFITL